MYCIVLYCCIAADNFENMLAKIQSDYNYILIYAPLIESYWQASGFFLDKSIINK